MWNPCFQYTCSLVCDVKAIFATSCCLMSPKNCWKLQRNNFVLLFHPFPSFSVNFSYIWDFGTACWWWSYQYTHSLPAIGRGFHQFLVFCLLWHALFPRPLFIAASTRSFTVTPYYVSSLPLTPNTWSLAKPLPLLGTA